MKTIKICTSFILLLCLSLMAKAQTLNWNSLENNRHIIHASAGWDYSLAYNLGYAYQVKTKMPLILNAHFSIPSGEYIFDDFKTKLGGQLLVLNKTNFKSSISLNGIYRRYENPLVRLQNIGTEMKGTFGFYKTKWFVAGEIGFDKAIVSHFKHSESFKENIYSEVQNGWYKPSSGGNFNYGMQMGYSSLKFDLTLNIGKVITQDLKTTPLIPFYFMFGFNYKM